MTATTLRPTPALDTWGKDHWSTYAYVECRIVDNRGKLEPRHMRGHVEARPDAYPTRLKDGATIINHDDYDCVIDAIAYGLLTCDDPEIGNPEEWDRDVHRRLTRLVDARDVTFWFTPLGQELAGALREHKANGGNFASFNPPASAAFRARLTGTRT